ncbi:ParA family protein [Flavihumibacter sp. ZG627]|uniref:ParA family protein n=1 Tax=Flavihumibacter sp. ZG627 TaxID=1463156 RepID=UPI00057C9C06|nr:ParA family protein [Flavihumibacter sp. ZG627]KIC91075.1 cobyrinic acid a,c-diamide synthase [Flavihumibacter sp. ZG627]
MISIALYNLKGGVGKTATCVNLSYLAAQDGYKVLLWDLDPQGSTSFYYNVQPKVKSGTQKLFNEQLDLGDLIMTTDYENIEIIPADLTARNLEIIMEEMRSSKRRFKTILSQLEKEYDFVFIDCPPGFSVLSENIFHAAEIILMPTIPTTLSVRTYEFVKEYFKEKSLDESKLMCCFTMVDIRKNMHNEIMEELVRDKKFFSNYIPYLSDVEKMGSYQAPLHAFSPSSYAAKCYSDLWEELKEGVIA